MELKSFKICPDNTISLSLFIVEDAPFSRYDPVLVLKFVGKFGIGCEGNGDARYMEAMTAAAVCFAEPGSVIYELSELDYQWGDMMHNVLHAAQGNGVDSYAIVVSSLCEKAISSLLVEEMSESLDRMHGSLDSALDFLVKNIKASN